MIVGLLGGVRRDHDQWDAAELNAQLQQHAAESKFASGLIPRTLSNDDLAGVRTARAGLLDLWENTARGEAMEIAFTRAVGR